MFCKEVVEISSCVCGDNAWCFKQILEASLALFVLTETLSCLNNNQVILMPKRNQLNKNSVVTRYD